MSVLRRGFHGTGVVVVAGITAVCAGDGVPAGAPSTTKTSPAGVRSVAIGVVSGVGGGGSGARLSVACSVRLPREQPVASTHAAIRSAKEAVLFT
jgi:hypothetical protein